MRIIRLNASHYEMSDVAMPEPQAGQVRIKVGFSGINRADFLQLQGQYPLPDDAEQAVGLELSGIIDAVGEGVAMPHGAQVCAIVRQGAFADYVVTDAKNAALLPENMAVKDGAAVAEALATMHMALMTRARIGAGESLLLHGASGGIGHVMLQYLAAEGVRVIACVSDDKKAEFCMAHGAAHVVNYRGDWCDDVRQHYPAGVDVVLDMAGGETSGLLLRQLTKNGRMVTLACLEGGRGNVPIGRMLTQRLSWFGCTLRDAVEDEKSDIMMQLQHDLLPKYCTNALRPVIRGVFPLKEAEKAVRSIAHMPLGGKILLQVEH